MLLNPAMLETIAKSILIGSFIGALLKLWALALL